MGEDATVAVVNHSDAGTSNTVARGLTGAVVVSVLVFALYCRFVETGGAVNTWLFVVVVVEHRVGTAWCVRFTSR